MKELRAQASTAERAVADYKAKNNIVDAGGRLLTEQQLAEINSALTIARAQRADAQARLERITAILKADDNDTNVILNDLATVTDTMQNPVIVKLRQTYLDYAAKEADWANKYGSSHLAVVNLRNQMREIRRSITDELRRTAEGFKSDFEIAKAREEASQKSLNDTIAISNDTSQAQIVLKDLESNAQSARALADNFLQLYMVSVQQQSFPITEARVITQASVPLSKSSPKTLVVLLAAIIGGTVLAAIAGVLRDMMDRVFRTVLPGRAIAAGQLSRLNSGRRARQGLRAGGSDTPGGFNSRPRCGRSENRQAGAKHHPGAIRADLAVQENGTGRSTTRKPMATGCFRPKTASPARWSILRSRGSRKACDRSTWPPTSAISAPPTR